MDRNLKYRFDSVKALVLLKHLYKKCLCNIKGVRLCGENAYISLRAIVMGGDRIRIGSNAGVREFAELIVELPGGRIEIGRGTYIFPYSQLRSFDGWIKLGENCTVNRMSILYGNGGLDIGNHVRISPNVTILAQNHVFSDPDILIHEQGMIGCGIKIEDDVWIGAGAIVLDGVTIGTGSVIGAGAVVSKNIPPFSVAVGVPAQVVGKRESLSKSIKYSVC